MISHDATNHVPGDTDPLSQEILDEACYSLKVVRVVGFDEAFLSPEQRKLWLRPFAKHGLEHARYFASPRIRAHSQKPRGPIDSFVFSALQWCHDARRCGAADVGRLAVDNHVPSSCAKV